MEKFVKYGIAVLVAIVLFIQLKSSHGKASSSADGISVLISFVAWGLFFAILLVSGLIVWFSSHKSYLILSFVFSLGAFLLVFFIVPSILNKSDVKETPEERIENLNTQQERDNAKKAEKMAWLDSLTKIFEANPNDLSACEGLGMHFANKVKYDLAQPYLEKAVENNSKNYNIYKTLADIYWRKQDFDKVEAFDLKVLQLEAEGKLVFEKYQHEKFAIQLEDARKAKEE